MGIERASTPEFQLIVGDNWPELDETVYASRASEQFANGQQMTQGASTVSNMASTVDANMEGATASASEAKSAERMSAMTAKSATFSNRATSTALAGQNILGTKTALNGIAEGYEVSWNTIKAQAVAEGWDQAQLQEAKDSLVDEFKGQADKVGSNFEQTDSELKAQIKTGAEPAVPASMPGGGAAGGMELPPQLMGQMQGMLGQGMGMAQQLPQQLQGALGPLGGQAQQGLDKVLQAVQGGGGGGGDVGVTPEMLDELLAGQDSGGDSGGSEPKGAEAAESEDGFKGENTDAAQASPVSLQTGGGETGAGGGAGAGGDEVANAASAPSPAESPVTAAPPASASIPETQLSGDSGSREPSSGSPAGGSGTGGAGGAGASNAFRGDDQGVPRQSPVSDAAAGTHLTSDTMTAPAPAAGSLGSPAGAAGALGGMGASGLGAGMSASGLGAGMSAGGLGAGGMGAGGMGAPMSGMPVTPAATAPTPPAPAVTPAANAPAAPAPAAPGASAPTSGTPSNAPAALIANAPAAGATSQLSAVAPARDGGVGVLPAAVPTGGYHGAVQHMSSPNYTDAERRAGTVAAAVNTAFARAGVVSPVAVALLKDGLSVFVTSDGLGVLPHGVALPADVIPLSEGVEVNDLFRQDMTGCQNPGYVMKTVVDLGIIEDVRAIVATDRGTTEGVTYVTASDLKGASPLSLVVHRDQFAGISVDDIAEAIETVRRDWGLASKMSVEDALLNVTLSRWETVNDPQASKALVAWMIADAEESAANGRTGEAAYILLQAVYLGRPDA